MKKNLLLFSLLLTVVCANAQLSGYYTQGFEDSKFPPQGWDRNTIKGNNQWVRITGLAHTGKASAYNSYNAPKGINFLITPQFIVAANDSLSFWLAAAFLGFTDSLYVQVSTTNKAPGSFTTIATFADGDNYPPVQQTFERVALSLAAYTGQTIYVAFKHVDYDGDGILLDDVALGAAPPDVTAVSVDVPPSLNVSTTINPQATFQNLGSQSATFDVTLTEGSYTSTKTVTSLPAQNSIQVTFDPLTTPSTNTTLNFTAYSSLSGDANVHNDTVTSVSQVYIPFQNGGWISEKELPAGSFGTAVTSYSTGTFPNDTAHIFSIGGVSAAFAVTKSVYEYNTVTKKWSKKAPLAVKRYDGSSYYYNGKVYYIGGYNKPFVPVDNVSIYDIATDTWSEGSSMPVALGDFGAAQYQDSLLYVIGGYDGFESNTSVYIYNAASNTWSQGTDMPVDRYGLGAGIANNVLVVMGGSNNTGKVISTAYKGTINTSDPTQIKWKKDDNYPGGTAFRPGGTGVKNGAKSYVYFTGGDPDGTGVGVTGATYAYDATADAWTLGPVKTTPVNNLVQLTSFVFQDTVYIASITGIDANGIVSPVHEWLKLGSTSEILPIHLISFTATLQNNKTTLLNWKVAEDGTGGYYIIQRSSDSRNFVDITGKMNAGRIATTISYSGQDLLPFKGYTYYRIKIVNSDGSISYSEIRAVNNNAAGTVTMAATVYPNPSHGPVNVILQNNNTADAQVLIVITDIAGRKIITDNKTVSTSLSTTYNLKAGTYIITMTSQDGSFKQSQKLIVE